MSKAVSTLEGTCISLNPRIRITEYMKPFVERYMVVVPEFDEMIRSHPCSSQRKGVYDPSMTSQEKGFVTHTEGGRGL
jgi:hypothetical protein